MVVSLAYIVTIRKYNQNNPKHPVKYGGFLPAELKEEDEGMLAFTARATRRVYIYYSFVMPLLALAYVAYFPSAFITIVALGVTTLVHVGIYWASMWQVFAEDV